MLFLTSLHSEKVKQKKIRIRFNKDLGTLNRHYVKYYNTTSLMSENKKKKKKLCIKHFAYRVSGTSQIQEMPMQTCQHSQQTAPQANWEAEGTDPSTTARKQRCALWLGSSSQKCICHIFKIFLMKSAISHRNRG